ncbi:MAG TPA: GDYXXLXY domain-containing protein [Gemmataceae bacterium]|nr:GDYXXLXY domain-containing protein [Gemmataceae bacterium]
MTDPYAIQSEPPPKPFADRLVAVVKGWEKRVLLASIGFQLVVLLVMTALRAYALEQGNVYYVHVQPVDPRDLFRGDFVILSYAFSRLPSELWGDPQAKDGRTIYVELVPEGDGKHWRAGRYSFSPPVHGPYLRGKIVDRGRIEYGIESFFVQEGQGRRYEQAVRSGRLTAEIAVAPDGQAVLRNLHVSP